MTSVTPQSLIWYRYVDDIFSFWPSTLHNFDEFFLQLNSLAPSIKFKVEWETNDSLPFLDVLVRKCNGGLIFDVYRKPTHCDLYIHFFSYHSDSVKLSVICSMFLRALRICSPSNLDNENKRIWTIFRNLKYPDWFIKKAWLKARKTHYVPRARPDNKKPYLCLPYIKGMDNVKMLSKDLDVNIAFKYTSTIKSILVRNNMTDNSQAGVYKIPCHDCNLVYIGETGRSLDVRLKEHRRDMANCNMNNANFVHAYDNDHRIDWDSSEIIVKCNNYRKRRILESVCIENYNNYNLTEGMFKLDNLMRSLVTRSLPGVRSRSEISTPPS